MNHQDAIINRQDLDMGRQLIKIVTEGHPHISRHDRVVKDVLGDLVMIACGETRPKGLKDGVDPVPAYREMVLDVIRKDREPDYAEIVAALSSGIIPATPASATMEQEACAIFADKRRKQITRVLTELSDEDLKVVGSVMLDAIDRSLPDSLYRRTNMNMMQFYLTEHQRIKGQPDTDLIGGIDKRLNDTIHPDPKIRTQVPFYAINYVFFKKLMFELIAINAEAIADKDPAHVPGYLEGIRGIVSAETSGSDIFKGLVEQYSPREDSASRTTVAAARRASLAMFR